MIDNVKTVETQNSLFVFNDRIKKFSFFAALFLIGIVLVGVNIYIYSISFSLLKQKETLIEEEISEDTINTIIIKKGDTLAGILKQEHLSNDEIQKITKIARSANITTLKPGKKVTFEYALNLIETNEQDLNTEQKTLSLISFEIDNIKSVNIVKSGNDFVAETNTIPLTKMVTKYETIVDSNVISSLKKTGLSTNSIISLINAYSYQIDFQRQIQAGDKITVVTEKFVTSNGKLSHHGDIIYACIKTQGTEYKIYKYSPTGQKQNYDFFSNDGQSIKATLLKTPVKVIRISSNFGYRSKHPIHGYGAMHKGVDFSAPVGTPIYAAGDGVVEFLGWMSGYGRRVVINHGNGLSTVYAHASKFANNLKKGSRVRQGDTIAFVGTSGDTTGAHLHYEVRVHGKPINPNKFKSTPAIQLSGLELAKFNKFKKQVSRLEAKLDGEVELAANDIKEINLF